MKLMKSTFLFFPIILLSSCGTSSSLPLITYDVSVYASNANFISAISVPAEEYNPTGIPPYILFESFIEGDETINTFEIEYENFEDRLVLGYLPNDIVKEVSDYAKELYKNMPSNYGGLTTDENIIDGKLVSAYYKRKKMNLFKSPVKDVSWFDINKDEKIIHKGKDLTLGIIIAVQKYTAIENLHTGEELNISNKLLLNVNGLVDNVNNNINYTFPNDQSEKIVASTYSQWQEDGFRSTLISSSIKSYFPIEIIDDIKYIKLPVSGVDAEYELYYGKYMDIIKELLINTEKITSQPDVISLESLKQLLRNH